MVTVVIREQACRVEGVRLRLPAAAVVAVETLPAAPLRLVKLHQQMEPVQKKSFLRSQGLSQHTNPEPDFTKLCVKNLLRIHQKVLLQDTSLLLKKQDRSRHPDLVRCSNGPTTYVP